YVYILRVSGWRDRIVMAGDDERWHLNPIDIRTQISVANRFATGRVAAGWCGAQHPVVHGNDLGMCGAKGWAEPSAHRGVRDRSTPGCANLNDSLLPHHRVANPRRGTRKHDRLHAFRLVDAKPHRRQTSERQAADVCAIHASRVEDRDSVEAEHLDR